jgi:hypothetical protein
MLSLFAHEHHSVRRSGGPDADGRAAAAALACALGMAATPGSPAMRAATPAIASGSIVGPISSPAVLASAEATSGLHSPAQPSLGSAAATFGPALLSSQSERTPLLDGRSPRPAAALLTSQSDPATLAPTLAPPTHAAKAPAQLQPLTEATRDARSVGRPPRLLSAALAEDTRHEVVVATPSSVPGSASRHLSGAMSSDTQAEDLQNAVLHAAASSEFGVVSRQASVVSGVSGTSSSLSLNASSVKQRFRRPRGACQRPNVKQLNRPFVVTVPWHNGTRRPPARHKAAVCCC